MVNTHVKLYQYRRQAERQSMTDQLTGIANRRRYERYSAAKWREALRLQIPFSVCMFDIDHFKVYNDTFGHPAGDKAISAVARTAAAHMKPGVDFLARYGGEEFVMLSMGDSAGAIFAWLKLIRRAVKDLHIPPCPSGLRSVWAESPSRRPPAAATRFFSRWRTLCSTTPSGLDETRWSGRTNSSGSCAKRGKKRTRRNY